MKNFIFDENGNFRSNWSLIIPVILFLLAGLIPEI